MPKATNCRPARPARTYSSRSRTRCAITATPTRSSHLRRSASATRSSSAASSRAGVVRTTCTTTSPWVTCCKPPGPPTCSRSPPPRAATCSSRAASASLPCCRSSPARHGTSELHQFCRAEDAPAFEALLRPYPGATIHAGSVPGASDLDALLRRQRLGTHLYTCGPRPLMDAVVAQARALGWPPVEHPHRELSATIAAARRSGCAPRRSALTVDVPGRPVDPGGAGGSRHQRALPVSRGRVRRVPHHHHRRRSRNTATTSSGTAERAQGRVMMICVSRARTPELVLDI